MTVRLEAAASQVDVTAPEYRALLENLQANIIKSHGRDFTRHIFVEFTADAARSRRWLREHVAPKVTSACSHFEAALTGATPPLPDTGADPLIGQSRARALGDPDAATSYRWPAQWGQDLAPRRHPFASAVELEGGEYFFAPSLPFSSSL